MFCIEGEDIAIVKVRSQAATNLGQASLNSDLVQITKIY